MMGLNSWFHLHDVRQPVLFWYPIHRALHVLSDLPYYLSTPKAHFILVLVVYALDLESV